LEKQKDAEDYRAGTVMKSNLEYFTKNKVPIMDNIKKVFGEFSQDMQKFIELKFEKIEVKNSNQNEETLQNAIVEAKKTYDTTKKAYLDTVQEYSETQPLYMCDGAKQAIKAAKSIIKGSTTGSNQWISRVFYGATNKEPNKKNYVDEASVFCKNNDWELKVKSSVKGVDFVYLIMSKVVEKDKQQIEEAVKEAHTLMFPPDITNYLNPEPMKLDRSLIVEEIKDYMNTLCDKRKAVGNCKDDTTTYVTLTYLEKDISRSKIFDLCEKYGKTKKFWIKEYTAKKCQLKICQEFARMGIGREIKACIKHYINVSELLKK